MKAIGKKIWAIPEGYIPGWSMGIEPEFESHETLCVLNMNDSEVEISITLFFAEQNPIGPYKVKVPARRTKHVRLNKLEDPQPVPKGVDFSSVVESTLPIVVQHTRLDSRQSENALLTTMAYGE